jgi:TPR repeat protein
MKSLIKGKCRDQIDKLHPRPANEMKRDEQVKAVLERYDKAITAWVDTCAVEPSRWHRPDTKEFMELKSLLRLPAESGDALCQYALAAIYWQGLCQETEAAYLSNYTSEIEEATRWWVAAATQGHWPAVDNLVTSGVGPEAERARAVAKQLKQERPELVPWSGNMPVYGPEYMQALCKLLYGRVVEGEGD